MEKSIVLMEEGLTKVDSGNSAGSVVQIDAIELDLCGAMAEPEPAVFENFSIRGFVSDMRKKDWKKCWPFELKGDEDGDMVDKLPPMVVPNFRWWQCVQYNEAQRAAKGKMVVETGSDSAGTESCQNVEEQNGVLVLHSKANTDFEDMNEAGNSCDTSEANLQVIERLDNTTDASDMLCVDARPLCIVENPVTAELGNDGTLTAPPSKRKPKLRSLADIMGTEKNPTTETEAVLIPQLELDVVPVDVAKDAAIPDRKRKIDVGEDGGPSKVTCRKAAAKKTKGLNVDAGKTCGRVEIFYSGSEGDSSMRLGSKLDARVEPKKAKALNNNKKMKQKLYKEDRTAPVRKSLHVNGARSADLQKNSVPVEINFGKSKSGYTPSTIEETGPLFRSSEKICNVSKGKMPQVGADHDHVVHPWKSNLGDCNGRGKAALDLSLDSFVDDANDQARYRGIPDLNVDPLEGNQFASLPDKSLPLHKTLDASPSCRNGTTSEGKRQLRISESENNEASKEVEASDDIPMEIVELLAKNQQERAVDNSSYMLGINNSTRGYSPLCVDGRPSMINYLLNRTSGLTLRNGNMGVRQNTPQLNSYRLDTSRAEDSLLWSSSSRGNAPFHLNMAPPKHSIQPNSTGVDSFLNRSLKAKTVTDMKDGASTSRSTSLGSLDPYSSNDTIPAMQLLSLMDQRVAVPSSFKVGEKSYLDKSFSPSTSNLHPRLNEKQQSFHNGKYFSQNRQSGSKKASGSLRAQQVPELVNSKARTNNPALGVCSLNQNPADFSFPDARNEYTLSARDLKVRKRKEKSRMVNTDGRRGRRRIQS